MVSRKHAKTVIAFGTFDVIHPGHEYYLLRAKELGERLVVIVGCDTVVTEVKGRPPARGEDERVADVVSLGIADDVEVGHATDMYAQIEKYRPQVIALGYDQTAFVDSLIEEMERRGIRATIVRLPPYQDHTYKSSLLKKAER